MEHTPDADLFRDVVEAYQVLSVRESRVNYDLQRRKNPELFRGMSEFEFNLEHRRDLRDKRGQVAPAETLGKDSYAHDRLQQLRAERAKYNVNHIGYYKGGVPRKDSGPRRGKAIGNVGEFHSPQIHNFLEHHHQDTAFVTQEDAVKFKHWMGTDIVDFQRSQPYYPMHYDRDFNFRKDRSYWLGFIMLFTAGIYGYKRLDIEAKRWFQWKRREQVGDQPAHHYSNRGGVVLQKEFVGFEKYHANEKALMDWYKKAYPAQFQEPK